jgi:hypothetical protein
MDDRVFTILKWSALGNAIFMLLFMGFRVIFHNSMSWILVDALIVVASLIIADRYHQDGV